VALVPLSETTREISSTRRRPRGWAQADEAQAACGRAHRRAARLGRSSPPPPMWSWSGSATASISRRQRFRRRTRRLIERRPLTIVEGAFRARGRSPAPTTPPALSLSRFCARAARRGERHRARARSQGLPLGDASFAFREGERRDDAELTLPVEIRNDIARLEIAGDRSAGAVALLDKRWRRRSIGIVTGSTADTAQPSSPPPTI